MKRPIKLILHVVTVVVMLGGLKVADAMAGWNGHLVWDNIDHLYRCLGSPINCDFGET